MTFSLPSPSCLLKLPKSGTGTWDVDVDVGRGTLGRRDSGTWGRGDVGRGDLWTLGPGDSGT